MKIYKSLFEQDETTKLDNVELVDKLFAWFRENPYPSDHKQLHMFAKSLGLEANVVEKYIYAIVSCFISGGNYNKKGVNEKDFDPEEIKMGVIVEAEHVDFNNKNPVIKRIAELMQRRITFDHLADNKSYYTDGKAGTLQIEELANIN